jgi:hypothetical protein
MVLFSFILRIFKIRPRWSGTPEMFLAMVMEFQLRNDGEFNVHQVLKWGEVMLKVIKVNIAPYKNFPDLMQNGVPDYTMVKKLREKIDELNHRKELKKALYGEDVDLGDDDVVKSDSHRAVFARNMVKDLSKHVRFHEDDQKTIDKF